MRILVTGATGFVGEHLVRLLLSRDHNVFGTYLSVPSSWEFAAELVWCDLRDASSVRKIVADIRPHEVYHLAAQSSPSQSLEQTRDVYGSNFWGTYNLLESVRQVAPKARILVVGSGQCYGEVRNRKPLTESAVLSPRNPYALSKAAADMLAGQYYYRFGSHILRARPFNHTGPGQSTGFVCSDYARRIVDIDVGNERPVLRVRDADVRRDFSDVRDVVRAYELLIEKGKPGEAYNVASGRSMTVREIVSILVSFCSRRVQISAEHQEVGAGDIANLYGSRLKLSRTTGWKPRYNMRQTLRDLFEYWKQLSNKGACKGQTEIVPDAQSEPGFGARTGNREAGNVRRLERVPQRRGN
jgi:GDP-4-dehydro-6-deoxy-D-mannose reductase